MPMMYGYTCKDFPVIFHLDYHLQVDKQPVQAIVFGFGYGDLKGRFRLLVGKFPDIFGESEPRDLPSVNLDKPAK
jgi:hypothetical protein